MLTDRWGTSARASKHVPNVESTYMHLLQAKIEYRENLINTMNTSLQVPNFQDFQTQDFQILIRDFLVSPLNYSSDSFMDVDV